MLLQCAVNNEHDEVQAAAYNSNMSMLIYLHCVSEKNTPPSCSDNLYKMLSYRRETALQGTL